MKRLTAAVISFAAAALVFATPALATASGNVPPAPALSRTQPVWIGYLIMFFMVVVVVSISLMPSKRGHQD